MITEEEKYVYCIAMWEGRKRVHLTKNGGRGVNGNQTILNYVFILIARILQN